MNNRQKNKNENNISNIQALSINHKPKWIAFVLFFFTFFLYAKTISYEYTLDDGRYTFKNVFVEKGISSFFDIISKGSHIGSAEIIDYPPDYRPFILISFALENTIFGNSPKTNHFFNVLFYAILCTFIFTSLAKLFSNYNILFPLFISLIFIVHPLHTEVVANIKSRDEILVMLIGLIALMQFYYFTEKNKILNLIIGSFCFFICLLTKENGLSFLGIIPLTLYFRTNSSLKKIIKILLILLFISGLVLFFRYLVLGGITNKEKYDFIFNPILAINDDSIKLATSLSVFLKSFILFLFPMNLSWDYSYNQIPTIKMISFLAIFSIILILTLLIIAILGIKKKSTFSFAIFFFLIAYFIVSNFIITTPLIFSERGLFLGSLGLCMIFIIILGKVFNYDFKTNLNKSARNISIFLIIILILFTLKTLSRSEDWRNDDQLYLSGLTSSPNSCKVHFAAGSLYLNKIPSSVNYEDRDNNINSAIYEFKKALIINPKYKLVFFDLGILYAMKQNFDSSIYMYKEAIKIDSNDVKVLNNYALLLFNLKRYEESVQVFKKASLLPEGKKMTTIFLGLALGYQNLNDFQNAKINYEKVLEIEPENEYAIRYLKELNDLVKKNK